LEQFNLGGVFKPTCQPLLSATGSCISLSLQPHMSVAFFPLLRPCAAAARSTYTMPVSLPGARPPTHNNHFIPPLNPTRKPFFSTHHCRLPRALVIAHLVTPPPQPSYQTDECKPPTTPREHLVPQDPTTSSQSHFSPSTLNNTTRRHFWRFATSYESLLLFLPRMDPHHGDTPIRPHLLLP
jgi:hypothetical protein